MGKRKRSEAEWEELVGEQVESGMTQKAWCEMKGLNVHTFADRAHRMRKAAAGGAAESKVGGGKGWVELKARPAAQAGQFSPASGIGVEIGKFRIAVTGNFEERAFKRVCLALSEIC